MGTVLPLLHNHYDDNGAPIFHRPCSVEEAFDAYQSGGGIVIEATPEPCAFCEWQSNLLSSALPPYLIPPEPSVYVQFDINPNLAPSLEIHYTPSRAPPLA